MSDHDHKRPVDHHHTQAVPQAQANLSVEDITVMKLMEEVIELDQEINLKRKFINSRINMLNQIRGQHESDKKGRLIGNFLKRIAPNPNMELDYLAHHP